MPDLSRQIIQKAALLELELCDTKVSLLNSYINLLDKWNKAYNLTAIRDINEMLDRHLVDSLSIAKHIQGERFIDVGTGPGLPGIPLAILYPEKHFTLLDSNGKKTRFLNQSKIELGLDNISIINDRIENCHPQQKFDGVLSRAFATLEDMLEGSEQVCEEGGHFYAMKGVYPEIELQAIGKPYKVQPIHWQGNQDERHLVIISQSAAA